MARSKTTEANRLYWDSDESVAEIAQRLELSRRALYDSIQPLPAGRDCDRCGGQLTYENRSARNSDHATCQACEREFDTPSTEPQITTAPDLVPSPRLATAALAGAVIGALLTLVLVPRR